MRQIAFAVLFLFVSAAHGWWQGPDHQHLQNRPGTFTPTLQMNSVCGARCRGISADLTAPIPGRMSRVNWICIDTTVSDEDVGVQMMISQPFQFWENWIWVNRPTFLFILNADLPDVDDIGLNLPPQFARSPDHSSRRPAVHQHKRIWRHCLLHDARPIAAATDMGWRGFRLDRRAHNHMWR